MIDLAVIVINCSLYACNPQNK